MQEFDPLKLENQLCFPLYVCSKEIIRNYKKYLDEVDLTYTQYIAMMVMWEQKEINVKNLGEKLFLDSGTLTPLLVKLENKGYIKRDKLESDERNLVITLTKEGENLKNKVKDIPSKVGSCINLTTEESLELYKLLYKIIYKLEEDK